MNVQKWLRVYRLTWGHPQPYVCRNWREVLDAIEHIVGEPEDDEETITIERVMMSADEFDSLPEWG